MYFDFLYYRKVLSFAWSHPRWPGQRKTLFRLLCVVPLLTLFHTVCMLLDYLFYPALWRQKVVAPVFIVGHARSGTTLMHRLLVADGERFSYFFYWQMFLPALTQRAMVRAIAWLDAKLLGSRLESKLRVWDEKTFGPSRHIHNMGLWIAEEDQFVMNSAFVTQQWSLEMPLLHELDIFHIDQLDERRRQRWMRHYKRCVKRQLLACGANKTHLSKNPLMSGWVNALLKTFPDARVLVMVRNPIECIPSTLKLMELSWSHKKWSPAQYAPSLAALTEISFDSYRLPAQALAEHPDSPQCFVDYRQLTTEPKAAVEQAYQSIGLEISPAYQNFLSQQQDRERAHRSTFDYSLDDYSVSAEQIEQALGCFYQQYQWPRPSEQIEPAEPTETGDRS